jgi:hypothetical protein
VVNNFDKTDVEFLGVCSGVAEVSILLGYDIMLLGSQFPAFGSNMLVSKCQEPITQKIIPEEWKPQS